MYTKTLDRGASSVDTTPLPYETKPGLCWFHSRPEAASAKLTHQPLDLLSCRGHFRESPPPPGASLWLA